MSRSKYQELKDEYYHQKQEGIEYVFGNDQLQEYFKRTGYTMDDFKSGKLLTDGYGGIGTREAFEARDKHYEEWKEKVKAECTAESIFEDEWWNHECGLSYDFSDALAITRSYFPKYTPKQSLLNKLQRKFEELNW